MWPTLLRCTTPVSRWQLTGFRPGQGYFDESFGRAPTKIARASGKALPNTICSPSRPKGLACRDFDAAATLGYPTGSGRTGGTRRS